MNHLVPDHRDLLHSGSPCYPRCWHYSSRLTIQIPAIIPGAILSPGFIYFKSLTLFLFVGCFPHFLPPATLVKGIIDTPVLPTLLFAQCELFLLLHNSSCYSHPLSLLFALFQPTPLGSLDLFLALMLPVIFFAQLKSLLLFLLCSWYLFPDFSAILVPLRYSCYSIVFTSLYYLRCFLLFLLVARSLFSASIFPFVT